MAYYYDDKYDTLQLLFEYSTRGPTYIITDHIHRLLICSSKSFNKLKIFPNLFIYLFIYL